jgi:hypothetical protein
MKRSALRHLRSKGDAAAKQYFASNLRCQSLTSHFSPRAVIYDAGHYCCSHQSKASPFWRSILGLNTGARQLQCPAWGLSSSAASYTHFLLSRKRTLLGQLSFASSTRTTSREWSLEMAVVEGRRRHFSHRVWLFGASEGAALGSWTPGVWSSRSCARPGHLYGQLVQTR